MNPPLRPIPSRAAAFTLVEILAAVALLTIISLALIRITAGTAAVTQTSGARMERGSGLRQALDRIGSDLSSTLYRRDLAPFFAKQTGNDAFVVPATADGYEGDRGVSLVGYRIHQGTLERGVTGTGWSTRPLQFPGALETSDLATGSNNPDYEPLAERVFRMELEWLMEDGTLRASLPGDEWERARAMIVTLAVLDESAAARTSEPLDTLAALLPDAQEADAELGHPVIRRWSAQLESSDFLNGADDFPAALLRGIGIRQRTFPIRQ